VSALTEFAPATLTLSGQAGLKADSEVAGQKIQTSSQFTTAPPQHLLRFLPEPHGHISLC
jgi:hypothetical protein